MNLFKHSKPVIRHVEFVGDEGPGDLPVMWDAYKKGDLEFPQDLSVEDFIGIVEEMMEVVQELLIIEDYVNGVLTPIGIAICRNDGWQLEPHVQYFQNATPKTILRSYIGFLKKTKYRKDIGCCVVKVEKQSKPLPEKAVKMGLLEYVGKVWGGKPSGNEYIYSVRCGRRVN